MHVLIGGAETLLSEYVHVVELIPRLYAASTDRPRLPPAALPKRLTPAMIRLPGHPGAGEKEVLAGVVILSTEPRHRSNSRADPALDQWPSFGPYSAQSSVGIWREPDTARQ